MDGLPENLSQFIEDLRLVEERTERLQVLVSIAKKFKDCIPERAERPFSELAKIPGCESETYAWAIPQSDGTLRFCFAVENPQGISAMLLAYLLDNYLSSLPLDQILSISSDVIYDIFGHELSMGKELGLRMMVERVKWLAKEALRKGNEL